MSDNVTRLENIETEIRTFTISSDFVNTRLDAFLASQIASWSRSRLQRLIEDGDVLVNGKVSKPSYKLRANDCVDVELVQPEIEQFIPEDIPLDIVYEDDAIIVVNKPAGLVIHPGAGIQNGTLANALAFHFQTLAQRGGVIRPGIVHRLDKDTSGLIVIAKTESAHENLSDQFRKRDVFKSYVALVHGVLQQEGGMITEAIARDAKDRTKMTVFRGGRSAITIFRVHQRFERFTLVDVRIKTGRTHQIRVHLAHINHPVVGDETYNNGRDKTVVDVTVRTAIAKLNRVFLHAEQLGFYHPTTTEWIKFKSEMPNELSQLLADLK